MFRLSKYFRNMAESFGSRLIASIIAFFSTCRTRQLVIAVADDVRQRRDHKWPQKIIENFLRELCEGGGKRRGRSGKERFEA